MSEIMKASAKKTPASKRVPTTSMQTKVASPAPPKPPLDKPFLYAIILTIFVPLLGPFLGGFVIGYLSKRGALLSLAISGAYGLLLGFVCLILGIIIPSAIARIIFLLNALLCFLPTTAIGGFVGGWFGGGEAKKEMVALSDYDK